MYAVRVREYRLPAREGESGWVQANIRFEFAFFVYVCHCHNYSAFVHTPSNNLILPLLPVNFLIIVLRICLYAQRQAEPV